LPYQAGYVVGRFNISKLGRDGHASILVSENPTSPPFLFITVTENFRVILVICPEICK